MFLLNCHPVPHDELQEREALGSTGVVGSPTINEEGAKLLAVHPVP